MTEFASPASASGISWADLKDALLIVEVNGVEDEISTAYGPTDAVRANVEVVDGPQAGESYYDTLIFPRVLKSQLKSNVGKKVLGRLGQGQAKPGQSAPWMIIEATPQDVQAATAYVQRQQQGSFAAPAGAPAPPF